MSDLLNYISLGVIQGATEFLPVSSSGHLTIFSAIFGVNTSGNDLKAFFSLLHFGTFFAILLFTYKDIWNILTGLFDKKKRPRSLKYIYLIIIATIPAVIVGFSLEDFIDKSFANPTFAAIMLLVTASFLFTSDKLKKSKQSIIQMSLTSALLIGLFQAFAILPGISRSGMTIFAALLVGLSRSEAVKFSFLMSLPVIFGGGLLGISGLDISVTYSITGFIAAFITGIGGLWLLKKFVINGKLRVFAVYCIIFSVVALIYLGGI